MGRCESARVRWVARAFGVDLDEGGRMGGGAGVEVPLRGGEVVLVTGASGAGKSSLLRAVRRRGRGSVAGWIDLDAVRLPSRAVVDVMCEAMGGGEDEGSIVLALEALSRVGLGEVWTYLRTPARLSVGQRWRLRLAVGLALARGRGTVGRPCVLAADEFAAPLDRVTALVVARALRRAVDGTPGVCAVVATSREDLGEALGADRVVRCDFGAWEGSET